MSLPQAGLLGTIRYPNDQEETRDFDGPQVLVPEAAIGWLRDKLPNPNDRTEARRRRTNDVLFELVREGIVNALVHRDYGVQGAKSHLIVTPDTIEIRSPGRPVEPISLEQMQSFSAPMLSRNPALHYVFARMKLAEERGLGLRSLKGRAEKSGLPLPRYTWEDPYLVLTIYRSSESAVNVLEPEVLSRLNEDERAAWRFIAGKGATTTPELMASLDIDERKAQRILRKLVEIGLIRRIGGGPATHYEVLADSV